MSKPPTNPVKTIGGTGRRWFGPVMMTTFALFMFLGMPLALLFKSVWPVVPMLLVLGGMAVWELGGLYWEIWRDAIWPPEDDRDPRDSGKRSS